MKPQNALRLSLFIGLSLFLSSCSFVKNLTHSKQKTKTETDASVQENKSTTTETEKKTKTTIEGEELVPVPGSELSGSTPLEKLQIQPWTLEDMNQSATVSVDKAGNLKLDLVKKTQIVPLKVKKTIEENLKETKTEKSDSLAETHTKAKVQTEDSTKHVERSGGLPWYLWLLILLAILIGLAWKFRTKIPFM